MNIKSIVVKAFTPDRIVLVVDYLIETLSVVNATNLELLVIFFFGIQIDRIRVRTETIQLII